MGCINQKHGNKLTSHDVNIYFDMLLQRASSQLEAQQIVYITANFRRLNFVQLMKCQRCTYQAEHTETYKASKCTSIGIPIYWRRVKNLLMSLDLASSSCAVLIHCLAAWAAAGWTRGRQWAL